MKEIGRVLKMDWGPKVVSLGIYFKPPQEMNIPKEGKLYRRRKQRRCEEDNPKLASMV